MPSFKHTFCRICSPECPMVAELDDNGEVTVLRPDRQHPVSKGFACHKGLAYVDVHHDPDRLNEPMRRRGPRGEIGVEFEPIGWDEALAEIGAKLREIRDRHGVDAIASYGGNPIAFNSKAFGAAFSIVSRMGGRRAFNAGTQDMANKLAATEAVFGSFVFLTPDFYRSNYLLALGTNPRVSNWTTMSLHRPMHVLQDISARGGKVTLVNARHVQTAGPGTGDLVLIRPDTDVYFIAALLNEIDRLVGFKEDLIAEKGKNLEGLRAFVAQYPPERVAPVTGVDAETIRTIARDFKAADGAATHMSTGLNQSRQGTLCSWLLHMLSFVTGNLGRPGGEYYAKGWFNSVVPSAFSEACVQETPFGRVREIFGALPGNLLADFIELEDNPVRALIVISGNPLISMGGEERLRTAFPKLELIVSIDIYRNATAEYADYLLPAADWLEREDTNAVANGVQPLPYVQYSEAVVPPRHQRKDDWWIVGRLEQELGLPSLLESGDPLATDKALLAQADLTIEMLREAPHQTIVLPQNPRDAFYDDVVLAPDRKVDCCPAAFAEALTRSEAIFRELEAEDRAQLKLISLRTIHMHNGLLANVKALNRHNAAPNPLHIHPADADERGLAEGDLARVFNGNGEVITPIIRDTTLQLGIVALSHGYGHAKARAMRQASGAPGVNTNRLMPTGPGSFEWLSNMSHMTGVPVQVARWRAE